MTGWRTTPEKCADLGHPGVTYNPWFGQTWCLCGAQTYTGNVATHAACCGGPLTARDMTAVHAIEKRPA